MGICFGRKPPEKFVGLWTNGDTVRLRIWENGRIDYSKEGSRSRMRIRAKPHYDEYGFTFTMCCCFNLDAIYDDRRGPRPVFIVNDDVLIKVPLPYFGLPVLPLTTTRA